MPTNQFNIQIVSLDRLWEILRQSIPRGYFLAKENHVWIAVDNSTGETWTEEFRCKCQASCWLRGNFEVCH